MKFYRKITLKEAEEEGEDLSFSEILILNTLHRWEQTANLFGLERVEDQQWAMFLYYFK